MDNPRICYRVLAASSGFDVVFDHTDEPQRFATFDAAVAAARAAATARFGVFGRPSCVLVKQEDGVESHDVSCG